MLNKSSGKNPANAFYLLLRLLICLPSVLLRQNIGKLLYFFRFKQIFTSFFGIKEDAKYMNVDAIGRWAALLELLVGHEVLYIELHVVILLFGRHNCVIVVKNEDDALFDCTLAVNFAAAKC